MKFAYSHHRSLGSLHIGCEAPRAYFIPYQSPALAQKDRREESDRLLSLCGEWEFLFCKNEYELPELTADGLDTAAFDRIQVPKSWQMELGRNYDKPQYVNHRYPFPVDPPHIPAQNPCGLYVKRVCLTAEQLAEHEVYLNLEGVDSCFYLFINGKFVAYSQVSHRNTEVCLTPYLRAGENLFCLAVFKWCTGSYLEDQDKYRLSGIFREVYLLFRPLSHLRDIQITALPDAEHIGGRLTAELSVMGDAEATLTLTDPEGREVACGRSAAGERSFSVSLPHVSLWSDEAPALYRLTVACNGEYIAFDVGFRSICVRGRVVYLNGKPIKAKGVNRHDFNPQNGAAVTYEQLQKELQLIKAHNINMIRTSHYPSDPRMLTLCDRLGLYVCNEADLECHGMFRSRDKHASYADPEWDRLSSSPEWRESYLDRAESLLERDKNHPSVILWSVGNESGMGENHRAMADYFHRRIPGALVQADGATRRLTIHLTSSLPPQAESPACDFTDIDARMYVSPKICVERFINNPELKSPFWLCEHSHAMGNGPGCLEEYWQTIYAHDEFFGGCVWEFGDHSVNIGTEEAPKYTYGGDLGETLHDGNFCVDGLVSPDRTPHSGMTEYKQVLRPMRALGFDPAKKSVTLRNLRYFCDASDLQLHWSLQCNGAEVQSGSMMLPPIPPQGEAELTIPYGETAELFGYAYLNLTYRTARELPWAAAGYEVGHEQFALPCKQEPPTAPYVGKAVSLKENGAEYLLAVGETVACISKITGLLCSYTHKGEELLAGAVIPSIWRAPIDNDRYIRTEWQPAGYDHYLLDLRALTVLKNTSSEVSVKSSLALGRDGYAPFMQWDITYRMDANGLTLENRAMLAEGQPELPRFGLCFQMPAGYEHLQYFGKGPGDAYADKCQAATVGRYAAEVSEHFEHYVRPQENMAHAGSRWIELQNGRGHGLLCLNTAQNTEFSFNCSHYTDAELTSRAHDYELCPVPETVIRLDLCQRGIGSESCGLSLNEAWRIRQRELAFAVRLLPTDGQADPFRYIY